MDMQHWQDLVAIYALGDATEEEAAQVAELVVVNPEAAAYLAELEDTVGALAFSADAMPVSAAATAAVMARVTQAVSAEPTMATSRQATRPAVAAAPDRWQRLLGLFQRPAFAATAVALAVVTLFWALNLQQQVRRLDDRLVAVNAEAAATSTELVSENDDLNQTNQQLADQLNTLQAENAALVEQIGAMTAETVALRSERNETAAELVALMGMVDEMETAVAAQQAMQNFFSSPTLYTVALPGTEERPEAEAQLVVDPDSNMALLVVAGLDPLPQNSVYQVLLIRGTEHETAETFRVSTEGEGVLLVHSEQPIDSFDAVGVSIEPDGGSVQRTGEIVVLGSFIN